MLVESCLPFFAHGPTAASRTADAADRSHVRDFRILRSALRARRQFSYGALGRRLSEAAAATAVATVAAEGFAGAITSFPASAAAAVGERKVIIGPSSHFHGEVSHSLWYAIDTACILSDLQEYMAL